VRSLRSAFVVALALAVAGCGTVEKGQDITVAEVVFDQNYFYCKVEPMLIQQKCGPGDGNDPPGGCHFSVTTFKLLEHNPPDSTVPCNGLVPQAVSIPPESQANYQTAQTKMSANPDQAALLLRPTNQALHPRKIFEPDSPEANLIREWATKYSSQ
jgi:hypothetical protein